jgi:hypothetical protein
MAMRTAVVMLTSAGLLTLGACRTSTSEPPEHPGTVDAASGEDGDDAVVGAPQLDKQLPAELVAELRRQGDDANGRLVTLAPGFIATAACSDCGAPSYLWFVAVRCSDERHCEVLTEVCSGTIGRDADLFALEFQAVEGAAADATQICAGYTGTFESP